MTADPFTSPSELSSGSGTRITEFVNRVLLITPTEYKTDQPTSFGDKDCVVANVVVVDTADPDKSEVHDSLWIFQGRLIGKLKGKVGAGIVLGKLIEDKASKKSGQAAPYDLADVSSDERAAAVKAYEKFQAPPF